MRTQVSVIALATALLASSPAMAQISLGGDGLGVSVGGDSGVNVNIGAGSDGLNVDAGVGGSDGLNVGAGVDANDGLNVDAGVGLGGSDGLNVDAGVGVGGSNELVDVDVDAGVGGANGINADVDAEIGDGGVGPNGGRLINLGSQGDLLDVDVGGENGGTRVGIAALDEAARVEALIGRIGDPQLADVDLDAVVDDQRVSIVALADLLNGESLAEVEAAIDLNSDGRAELLDAVGASEVLSSILGREGIAIEDVLSVSVNDDGATEIVVLGGGEGSDGESEGLLGGVAGLTETELADLDVDLLSDEELAEVDLALLPQEEQRVDAVLRLLSTGGAADDESGSDGTTRVVDLSVLLGEDALAIVDEALGDTVPEVDAELTAQLEALGIDPEAVVALGTDAGGNQRVFLNTAVLLPGGGAPEAAAVAVAARAGRTVIRTALPVRAAAAPVVATVTILAAAAVVLVTRVAMVTTAAAPEAQAVVPVALAMMLVARAVATATRTARAAVPRPASTLTLISTSKPTVRSAPVVPVQLRERVMPGWNWSLPWTARSVVRRSARGRARHPLRSLRPAASNWCGWSAATRRSHRTISSGCGMPSRAMRPSRRQSTPSVLASSR